MVEHWTFNPLVLGSNPNTPIIFRQLIFFFIFFIRMEHYLILSTILFFIGLFGIVLNRRNILIVLMSIELMLLAINLNFVIFSNSIDDIIGQVFALLVLTVAAAESAIGLAILVIYYRLRGNILIEQSHLMRG